MGRPFTLRGPVVHGRKLGRTIGFPTANVLPDPAVLLPGPGVYAGRAALGRGSDVSWHRAAISVGTNPTVVAQGEDAPTTVEAYLMDGFDGDLYGETLTLEFRHFLRGMEKFASLEALIAGMGRDVARAAELVSK
ncbi:MAG TPA: riboflavin kinase [Armatimonadaceae bacterium]|nr:riboflavin kinase [Armatimonadaceae bacterium]